MNPFDALVVFFDAAGATPLHRRLTAACYEPVADAPAGFHLDVGCGTGGLVALSVAAGRPAIGLDVSLPMCRRAARRVPEAHFVVGALECLPFNDASFSALTAMLVLHLSDVPRALAESARVLRPNGVFSLVTQSSAWSETAARAYVARHGVEGTEREFCIGSGVSGEANRRFSSEELRATLGEGGLAIAGLATDADGGFWVVRALKC